MMRNARPAGALDMRTIAEGMSYPGIDPRTELLLSFGTVADEDPVVFDEDLGPVVSVNLQPSNILTRCRLAMQVAGAGEGEYTPFVEGDEVIVGVPRGSTWAGAVILGRLANSVDKFPSGVGGQDATTNTFAFKRVRTAYTLEAAGAIFFREATSGAFVSIDKLGVVTIRDGQGAALQISPDVFGYQSADATQLFQLATTDKRFTLQVEDALFVLASGSASPDTSALVTPSTLSVSTATQPAAERVLTTEAFCNILVQVLTLIGSSNPGPIFGAVLAASAPTAIAGALALAAVSAQNPIIGAAIEGAFQTSTQKPPAVQGLGQTKPGIGCPGFIVG